MAFIEKYYKINYNNLYKLIIIKRRIKDVRKKRIIRLIR